MYWKENTKARRYYNELLIQWKSRSEVSPGKINALIYLRHVLFTSLHLTSNGEKIIPVGNPPGLLSTFFLYVAKEINWEYSMQELT